MLIVYLYLGSWHVCNISKQGKIIFGFSFMSYTVDFEQHRFELCGSTYKQAFLKLTHAIQAQANQGSALCLGIHACRGLTMVIFRFSII